MRKGFTLIELLIVIGIIAILMAMAIVAINPGRQFAKANDARRQNDTKQITDAIQYNIIDNKGFFLCAAGDIPTTESVIRSSTTTFPQSDETKDMPYYDLCTNCLVPTYFGTMPIDPQKGGWESCSNYNTEYTIQKTSSITIRAPHAQLGAKIEIILPGEIMIKIPEGTQDTTPPTVGVTSPTTATVNVAADFSAPVSDNIAVTACNLFVDGADQGSMNLSVSPCTNCTASRSYTFTSAGTFPIYARCSDAVGNTTNGTSVDVTATATPTPDFSISASPTSLRAPRTSGASDPSTTVTVTSLNGFSNPVTLSARWCTGTADTTCSQTTPSGVTPSFSPNPVTPTGNSTLSFDTSNTPAGTYYFRVRGISGALSHDTSVVTLTVVDLSVALTANPSSGSAPLNGVDLTATVSGSATGTINYRFDCTNDGTWDLQINNSTNPYTAVDVCNYASAGNYTAKVRAERDVANPAENTATVTVTAGPTPDFTISASPTTIKAPQTGTSQSSTITITSLNNFNSAVTLSVTAGLPTGATANFSPSSVTPPSNGTATSTFTVTTSNVTAGSYNLTIRGQSGTITKTTNVTLTVVDLSVSLTANPSSGSAPLNGVDLTATVSGSATGTINYKFDCTNDGTWDFQINNSSTNPYTAVDVCNYSSAGTYTAKVRAERDVANLAEGTKTITVTEPAPPGADFSTSISPSLRIISPGGSTTYDASAQSINSFSGSVKLYASIYDNLNDAMNDYNNHYNWSCTTDLCRCNRADVNRDGVINNTGDLAILASFIGQTCSIYSANSIERYNCNRADVDRNGLVNNADVSAFQSVGVGKICAPFYLGITLAPYLTTVAVPAGGSASAVFAASSSSSTPIGSFIFTVAGVYTSATLDNGPERIDMADLMVNP